MIHSPGYQEAYVLHASERPGSAQPTPGRRVRAAWLALLVLPFGLRGQAHDHGEAPSIEHGGVFPPGWTVRTDEVGELKSISLAAMPPGWHVTTAASAIMYRGTDQGSGSYQVTAKIHLFPSAGGHAEAFGVFIGGRDLAGPGQRYTYFLIRGDGSWKIKRRSGAAATDVSRDWVPSAAIVRARADGPVTNLLGVLVDQGKVSFRINGQEVHSAPAASLDTEGITGLRVNHNLSLHVESLDIQALGARNTAGGRP